MSSHVSKVISHTVEEVIKELDGFATRIQTNSEKTNRPISKLYSLEITELEDHEVLTCE